MLGKTIDAQYNLHISLLGVKENKMVRFIFPVIITALVFNVCSRNSEKSSNGNIENRNEPARTIDGDDLRRETIQQGIEVTFYPAYGYRNGTDWHIPIRSWVHENRELSAQLITRLAQKKIKCDGPEIDILKLRFGDFPDDDKFHQKVTIEFDSDPDKDQYLLGKSDVNGLIETELKLSEAKARRLLESQGSHKGWLTYRAVSNGHTGKGRIKLIEPEGVSVVTDIDDTIKVTGVPAEKATVLRNTFCRDFVGASGMADLYKEMGNIPFHYVSGGPWQLYGPLYDFLISGPGGYPEGTFHFSYFPKNILGKDTRAILIQTIAGSMEKTYWHKVTQITNLLERFPSRKFILIGDSGELDPEVYRLIRDKYPQQVQEIWIRDVINDAEVNQDRLESMKVIKAESIICVSQSHYKHLSAMLQRLNRPSHTKNRLPPCNQQ
jgi:phosphatidate phosphatase APP1